MELPHNIDFDKKFPLKTTKTEYKNEWRRSSNSNYPWQELINDFRDDEDTNIVKQLALHLITEAKLNLELQTKITSLQFEVSAKSKVLIAADPYEYHTEYDRDDDEGDPCHNKSSHVPALK